MCGSCLNPDLNKTWKKNSIYMLIGELHADWVVDIKELLIRQ